MFYVQLSSNEDKLNEIIESSDSFLLPLASLSPDRLNTQHITDHLSIFDLVLKQTTKNDYESDEFRGDSILANVSKSIFMVLISYSNKFSSLSSSVIETLCYFVNSVLEFFITRPTLIDLWFIKLIYDQDIVALNPSVTRQYFPIQDLLHELLLGGDYPIIKLERLFILYLSATNTSKELKIWIANSDFVSTVVNCFLPILNLLTSKENLFASFRLADGDVDVILQDPDYFDYMNYTEFLLKLIGQTTDETIIGKFLSALKKDIIDKRIESYEVGNVSYDSPSFYLLATLLGKLLIQHDIGVLTTCDKLIISDLISHYFKDPNSKLFQTFKKAYIGSDSLSLQSIGSYHLIHQMLSSRPFPLVAELVTDSRFSEHYDRSKPSTSLNYVSIVELGSKFSLLCAEDQSLSSSEPLIEKLKVSFTDIMEDVIETKGPLDLSNCMFYRFEPTKLIPQLILSKFINFFNTDPSITARTVSLVEKLSTSFHLRLTNLFLNDYEDIDNPHHSDHIVFLQTFHYLSDCYEIYSRIAKESNLKNTPIKRETPGEELRSLIRQTVFDSDIHRHIEKTAYADTHFSSNTDLIENLRLYEGFLSTIYTTYQARNMLYGIFPKSKRTDSNSSAVAPPVLSIS
ncbi:hypothetical protein WICPIJ_004300 [Wickerhamomyces pijperi]|uniref:Uncharacterized protein n=1 Tax=Wickerhamomyces pijperi TaxID=599730 RepID=A0A9P8Q881_WICPI|nr:hypothetical protein WICPIJ_004300 [Wickerhamomyces pijperi]